MSPNEASPEPPRPVEESLFEEKPSSLLVWVVPSVLLHAVVVACWLMMPDDVRAPGEERQLVIKSEQAEQLQEFVEDANLVELRQEVVRLQSIKAAMAEIRARQMADLVKFEDEMKDGLKGDLGEVVRGVVAVVDAAAASQEAARREMVSLSEAYDKMKPCLERRDCAALAPLCAEAGRRRAALVKFLEQAMADLRRAQSVVASADASFSWIKDDAVIQAWRAFQARQDNVLDPLARSFNQQSQMIHIQGAALRRLADEGAGFPERLRRFAEDRTREMAEFERLRNERTQAVAAAEKAEAEASKEQNEWGQSVKGVQGRLNEMKRRASAMPAKTDDEKRLRAEAGKQAEDVQRELAEAQAKLKSLQQKVRDAGKRKEDARREVQRLRRPDDRKDPLPGELDRLFQVLSQGAGEPESLGLAMAEQKKAREHAADFVQMLAAYQAARQ